MTWQIAHNLPLNDGTPRRETGWRVIGLRDDRSAAQLRARAPEDRITAAYLRSPLMRTRAQAEAWVAFVWSALDQDTDTATIPARWDAFAARHGVAP